MSSTPQVLGKAALAGAVFVALSTFIAPATWAVDGGYGPTGGDGGSGGGALSNVIVSQTVGPGPSVLRGNEHDRKFFIYVPRNEFAYPEQVVLSTAAAGPCRTHGPGLGFSATVFDEDGTLFDGGFSTPARGFVVSRSITKASTVWTLVKARCVPDTGAEVHNGSVSFEVQGAPTFFITTHAGSTADNADAGDNTGRPTLACHFRRPE